MVADGMGGRPASEVVYALVISALEVESGAGPPVDYLVARIKAARGAIAADVTAHPARTGTGSTLWSTSIVSLILPT